MAAPGSFLKGLTTLFGGAGNAGASSGNAWQYGQYQPFNINNPMGQMSFNGTSATGALSPLQQQLQGQFGGLINNNFASGNNVYNPNTGFLPQQYQSIYGGPQFQNNVNSQFNALQAAQAPWLAQQRSSNLDNEFSKGTLASTAGGYQTAGFDQAANSLMQQNQNTAFGQASALANQQFGAANSTAGLGESQAEFRPQIAMGQNNSAFNNLLGQNGMFNQTLGLGGQLGYQRSLANVQAAVPGIQTGMIQDQATAGLLSGLLFGGGTQGGLMQSLLGTNSGGGALGALGSLGSKVGGLFGGGNSYAGVGEGVLGGSSQYTGGGGPDSNSTNPGNGDTSGDPGASSTGGDTSTGLANSDWWNGTSFNGAGGQAANPGLQNLDYSNPESLAVQNPNFDFGSVGSNGNQNPLSSLGSLLGAGTGFLGGISKGGATGDLGAVANLGKAYGALTGNSGISSLAGSLGGALGAYNGLTSGTPQGVLSGLAQGAGVAANSGAAAGLGASASTVSALAAGATGIGAVLAIPALGQGIEGLAEKIFPMNGGLGQGAANLLSSSHSGLQQRQVSSSSGGSTQFGLGSVQYMYNGKPVNLSKADTTQAWNLYQQGEASGNYSSYQAFMNSLQPDNSKVYAPKGGSPMGVGGANGTALGGGRPPTPFGG